MPDRDVLTLIDDAGSAAPTMQVDSGRVLAGGRRRLRRRRAVTGAGTIGALALAAAVWVGPGNELLLGGPAVGPSGQEQTTPTPQLTAGDGSQWTVTVEDAQIRLSGVGDEVTFDTASLQGPLSGLLGDERPVLLVPGWDLQDVADARLLLPADRSDTGEAQWVEPTGVVRVDLPDGRPVVILTQPWPAPPSERRRPMAASRSSWCPGSRSSSPERGDAPASSGRGVRAMREVCGSEPQARSSRVMASWS